MSLQIYHSYLFFDVSNDFYQLPKNEQQKQKDTFRKVIAQHGDITTTTYATLGFKTNTTFLLWCWADDPADIQTLVRDILHTTLGQWLKISYSYFGIVRESSYSGRTGKPEQVIQNYSERLPYFILYPFTKTTDWYQLDFENRKSIMGQHIKTGVAHSDIRQCLLYSYGVDDYEFLVSYETNTLEEFQDLIIEMRKTIGRNYTLIDTPIFTCIHKPIEELLEWL
jgi:chlorite dismutase